MKIIEVGTGYTSIPANMGAATEIVVEELAKVFEKEKVNYEILDIKDENRQDTDLRIKEVNVPKCFRKKDVSLGIMHKLKRVVYSINLAKALKKEIKNSDEEIVVHFHNQYNMFFFCKLVSKKIRRKAKLIYTVHSYIWNGKWEDIESTIKKKYFQEVFCVKNADKVFVLNNITRDYFVNKLGVNSNRIVKIDNGVNTDIYEPRENNSDEIIFFQSGSVCDRKNQLGAIEMLSKYLKENKNLKYVYAGGIIDQEYKNKIDEYIKNNNIYEQVEYVGELKPGKELAEYYNKAKAFIFPSIAEAFSLVILEAMASGLPVIMNKQSILDVDEKLKDMILFYNDKSTFDYIINNKILNEEERKDISNKSRETAKEVYSWEAVEKEYLENIK